MSDEREYMDCAYDATEKEQTDPAIEEALTKSSFQPPAFSGERPKYEIYALNWGNMAKEPGFFHFFLGDPVMSTQQTLSEVNMYMWIIRGAGRTILFDVSCSPEMAEAQLVTKYVDRTDLFAKIGMKIEDIDTIIISHMDFDHFSGISAFKKSQAPVYMHEAAIRFHIQIARRYPLLRTLNAPSLEEVQTAVELLKQGSCRLLQGKRWNSLEIEPGISVMRTDGHVAGHQVLIVNTEIGPVVLAADIFCFYKNLETEWPTGIIRANVMDVMNVYPKLKAVVKDGGFIVPGHDTTLAERFTEVQPGVVKIA